MQGLLGLACAMMSWQGYLLVLICLIGVGWKKGSNRFDGSLCHCARRRSDHAGNCPLRVGTFLRTLSLRDGHVGIWGSQVRR